VEGIVLYNIIMYLLLLLEAYYKYYNPFFISAAAGEKEM